MAFREELDQQLAKAALEKRKRGQKPSVREAAALRRFEAAQEERMFLAVCRRMPQKWWREWSGRQTKQLKEQAERYGLPFGGRTIDLPAVVEALHNFLAANARKLAKKDGDPADTAWLERMREEEYHTRRLKRLALEGEYLPRAEIHQGLMRYAGHIRQAGEVLGRDHGPEAQKILSDALADAQREINGLGIDDSGGPL